MWVIFDGSQDAIEAGDLTVVDAILGTPAVLSGIPANLHANMQNMAKRKFSAAQEQAVACGKVSPR